MSTNETNTKTVKTTALHGNTLRAFRERTAELSAVVKTHDATVLDAQWARFTATVTAHVALGAFLTASILPKLDEADRNGERIAKALKDEASPIFVATADREGLPSASVMSRALSLSGTDTADRREAFKTAGNAPSVQDYVLWSQLAAGASSLRGSTVDIAKTVTTDDAGKRIVGKLVKTPSAKTPKVKTGDATSPTVVGFFVDLMSMSSDDLTAVVDAGPTDITAIPEAVRRDLARQLMAAVVLSEQAAKLVVPIG